MASPVNLRICLVLTLAICSSNAYCQDVDSAEIRFFESKIRPLLLEHCADCHGADTQESDLRLDTPGHITLGGKSGPVLVPLKPDKSLLISAIRHQDEALTMPPDEKIPEADISLLVKWVEMGAPMPKAEKIAAKQHIPFDLEKARKHWSFTPLKASAIPKVDQQDRSLTNPIDKFLFAKLNEKGLVASPPAKKTVLIRRAYLDLIGLPPTPEQIRNFLSDESPEAYETVIDELLASSHYGERWGRHWLDIARYADSNGLDENVAHGNAWKYRDYVIAAFNSDKPFDEFIKEQIAGDLLSEPSHEQLIGTGFLSLGPKVLAEGDETKMQMDIIDEQIDTTGRVFLGLTFGCARCHDHKFDPIRADDYYALAGIFKSTKTMESLKRIAKWNEHVIASPEQLKEKELHDNEVASVQASIDDLKKQQTDKKTVSVDATGEKEKTEPTAEPTETAEPSVAEQLKTLDAQLKKLKESAPELPTAMGVVDGDPIDVPIHVRGSHLSLGRDVTRGIPLVLATGDPALKNPKQSGRLELANWLASSENPLTVRVWVNRVWRWHTGEGIVSTVDNFGILGSSPTHPELLDWLALEFIKNGWSTKELHRQIMLSQTYQMSSDYNAQNAAIDPENQYHWRSNQLRMEAEVFRDSVLAISGQLDSTMGGSLLHVKNREFIFNHTSKDETNYESTKRSVYLPVIRNNLYVAFSLFDYTDASVPNGNRATSTVAPQALYALNSPFILTAAEKLAERLTAQNLDDLQKRTAALYEQTYGRLPTQSEVNAVLDYLSAFEQSLTTSEPTDGEDVDSTSSKESKAWTNLCQTFLISNEFIYVE